LLGQLLSLDLGGHCITISRILHGEYPISGLNNRRMPAVLPDKIGGQINQILKRLRLDVYVRELASPIDNISQTSTSRLS